jgi:large subunit ribosomal protein L25
MLGFQNQAPGSKGDAVAEVLKVAIREQLGTSNSRRLRSAGSIPAVLYGHGEASVSLSIPADQVSAAIRHGSHLVDLQGAVTESALIREVQWDPMGAHVLHMDLTRVSAGESVSITLAIDLRGDAPGTKNGGVVEHVLHEVEIECPVTSIPDRLELRINNLELDGAIFAKDLGLPEGAKLLTDPDAMIVHCVTPMVAPEEMGAPAEVGEPEIIGKKPEDEAAE